MFLNKLLFTGLYLVDIQAHQHPTFVRSDRASTVGNQYYPDGVEDYFVMNRGNEHAKRHVVQSKRKYEPAPWYELWLNQWIRKVESHLKKDAKNI